jgi:hypothetical protein
MPYLFATLRWLFVAAISLFLPVACATAGFCGDLPAGEGNAALQQRINKVLKTIDAAQPAEAVLGEIRRRLSVEPCVDSIALGNEVVETLPPTIHFQLFFHGGGQCRVKTVDVRWTEQRLEVVRVN